MWQMALVFDPALAIQLSVVHLVVWLVLMLQLLWSLVNALAEEPLFNGDLLRGLQPATHWWASQAAPCSILF